MSSVGCSSAVSMTGGTAAAARPVGGGTMGVMPVEGVVSRIQRFPGGFQVKGFPPTIRLPPSEAMGGRHLLLEALRVAFLFLMYLALLASMVL